MVDPTPKRTAMGMGLLALASVVFNWPFLGSGFQADDLIFLEVFRTSPLPFERWRGMWTSSTATFDFWWAEAGAKAEFWRPLPSLIFEASLRLFGEAAFPLHLLSVLVHGAVAATLFLIVQRLMNNTFVAMLAGILFVACEDHTLTVGWIATMTDPLCVLFLHLATIAHLGWLGRHRIRCLVTSMVCIVAALACKESAVVIAPILILLSWALPEGRVLAPAKISYVALGERTRRLLRDPMTWAPYVVLTVVYLAVYKGLQPAQMNNLMYANPLVDPVGYLQHLTVHLPVVWLATLSPVPPSLTMFLPSSLLPLALAGVLSMLVWGAALWPWRQLPIVVWAFASYVLATLPQMGADASERLLYYPFTFAALLFAMAIAGVGFVALRFSPDVADAPRRVRAFGVYVLAGVLLPGVVMSAAMPFAFRESLAKPELQALTAVTAIHRRAPKDVIVLNTPGMFSTFYVGAVLDYHLSEPIRTHVLSSANALVTIEKVGPDAFVLRMDRPGWLTNMFARVARVTPRLTAGATYPTEHFTARLVELTPDGTDTLAVEFQLHPRPGHEVLLLTWNGTAFEAFDLDAVELGKHTVLADTSDVFSSM